MKNAKKQLKSKIQEFFGEERWDDIVSDTPPQEHKRPLNIELLIELYKSKFPIKNLSGNETVTRL